MTPDTPAPPDAAAPIPAASPVSAAPDPAPAELAFAEAAVGLAVLGADGQSLAEANPALCAILGHAPGSLSGRPLADILDPLERDSQDLAPRDREIRIFPGSGEAGPLRPGVQRWRRADGGRVAVRVRVSGPGGRVLAVEAVDTDAAAHAEENREALTQAGLGEWRWDAASGRLTLSRRAARILGRPEGGDTVWADLIDGFSPEELARISAEIGSATERGEPYAFQCRHTAHPPIPDSPADPSPDAPAVSAADAPSARTAILGVRGRALRGPDGAVTGMVGVLQDLTTRVEARDELTARDQRLRVATTLARLGIFEWHMLEDRAIWENERMYEVFGRAPEDGTVAKNEFLNEILHPDDRDRVRRAISSALRDDAILHASGRVRRASDGAWRWIDMAGRFERDAPNRLPRRLIGVVADVTDRRLADERQTLLIRELHHRVKNTLATVQAIVGSTARTASSIESFYEAFVGRIKSLAHTHSVLTEATWQTASLRNLLVNELRPYAEEEPGADTRVLLEGPDIALPSEIAVPIGMAIHELTTNAAKHGALSNRSGRIAVAWGLEPAEGDGPPRLAFRWRESGGPPVRPPSRQGFGSRLLQRVLSTQVQAEVVSDYAPDGFSLTMTAPLPARNDALNPLA